MWGVGDPASDSRELGVDASAAPAQDRVSHPSTSWSSLHGEVLTPPFRVGTLGRSRTVSWSSRPCGTQPLPPKGAQAGAKRSRNSHVLGPAENRFTGTALPGASRTPPPAVAPAETSREVARRPAFLGQTAELVWGRCSQQCKIPSAFLMTTNALFSPGGGAPPWLSCVQTPHPPGTPCNRGAPPCHLLPALWGGGPRGPGCLKCGRAAARCPQPRCTGVPRPPSGGLLAWCPAGSRLLALGGGFCPVLEPWGVSWAQPLLKQPFLHRPFRPAPPAPLLLLRRHLESVPRCVCVPASQRFQTQRGPELCDSGQQLHGK